MARNFSRIMLTAVLAAAASLTSVSTSPAADDLPTADALLKRLAEKVTLEKPKAADDDQPAKLREDVAAYRVAHAKLKPEESAKQWLALFDRQGSQSRLDDPNGLRYERPADEAKPTGPVQAREILIALPSPAHWDALAKQINARAADAGTDQANPARLMALELLSASLSGNVAERNKLIEKLDNERGSLDNDTVAYAIRSLAESIKKADASQSAVEIFEAQLAKQPDANYDTLAIPDLVTLVGEDKADALIVRLLTETAWPINTVAGDKTKQLVRRLALAHVDDLRVAPWRLIQTPSDVPLYEALQKKFPLAHPKEPGVLGKLFGKKPRFNRELDPHSIAAKHRREADATYLAGLIQLERFDDAVAVAAAAGAKLGGDDYHYHHAQSFISALKDVDDKRSYQFLKQAVIDHPTAWFWDPYLQSAAKLGKTDEALNAIKAAAFNDDLHATDRAKLQDHLARALLAADQVENAIDVIKANIAEQDHTARKWSAKQFVQLGRTIKNEELIKQGLEMAIEAAKQPPTVDEPHETHAAVEAASLLVDAGRVSDAVDILISASQKARAAHDEVAMSDTNYAEHLNNDKLRPLLIGLVSAYHRAGRHADVLAILQKAPDWGAGDLLEFVRNADSRRTSIGYMAAAALLATGDKAAAVKIINELLDSDSGDDPTYELLLKAVPDRKTAIAMLDDRFEFDQFEERPLIWKAKLLLDDGQLKEAEKIARRAISIDPSDGEQPRGDRMRVYAILADILEKQENTKDAELYRNVVKAIRMSEDADLLREAGLLKRGIAMYKDSLKFFQDAYCIQSRLALQLAEAGDLAGAEKHYRKAFELMPDSFGRMESHCFGCEGAFRSVTAQTIAEEVFTKLAKAMPDKPQIHYLLAYLRDQQGREHDAIEPLRTAVKLDPDYINAWKKILELKEGLPGVAKLREEATLNLIRLDPGRRHGYVQAEYVTDLRALWNAIESAEKFRRTPATSLLPLPASAAALAARPKNDDQAWRSALYDNARHPTAAETVVSTQAFELIMQLMEP